MSISSGQADQDSLYEDAVDQYGPSLARLASAYEADSEKRRDLSQEIHFQLWRSFCRYTGRCSLRTWVYRVAHHVACSYVVRQRRLFSTLVSLEELEEGAVKSTDDVDHRIDLAKLWSLVRRLKPLDRQVIVSYLEGMDAASIGQITGLAPANVAMRIHRIKKVLAGQFHLGNSHAE